ncbi:MAG: MerR family transcriptional regulator [Nitrospiraceae bacterium]|nr:MerR family transcriptional regulator [Nitrospiraceae bacterium]
MTKKNKNRPLYMISVVSKMLGVHPQTLRTYEREGFISPQRTKRLRLYSEDDVEKLNFIISLTREMGVNKAGVDIILRMRNRLDAMHKEAEEMMQLMDEGLKQDFEKRMRKIFFADVSDEEEEK